jgi:protein tyrosine phosphatase (PTP) superfamily phosphohydrolase (DUF442 family)
MSALPRDDLREIRNFYSLGPELGTSGQPTETQFETIRSAGFETVINLALPTSDHAIPHEGTIVTSHGMVYVHIPVNFQTPTVSDFQMFCRTLDACQGRPVFVHCAANKRVSAFLFLYRVLKRGMSRKLAEHDLHAVWQPDPVWQRFIDEHLLGGRSEQNLTTNEAQAADHS